MHGFANELVKEAKLGSVSRFLKRIEKSPELRSSIRRSTLLGAGTGAATNVMAGNDEQGILRRLMGGAAVGAVGGGITGGAFPAWFGKSNMRAADEVKKRLGRRR